MPRTRQHILGERLRQRYLSTRAGVENNITLLVERAMERMPEQEQFSFGWEEL